MRLAQVVVAAELVVKGKKQQCVNAAYGTGGVRHMARGESAIQRPNLAQ